MHEHHKAVELHAPDLPGVSRWLIAGVTGRALAQSAVRGGHEVVVLDYFADRDCAEAAIECLPVSAAKSLRFNPTALLHHAARLAPANRSIGLVYGSGFEARTGLLRKLSHGRVLYGNSPETVELLKNPSRFFPLLARLGISHPDISLTAPARSEGWLAKESGGAGGVHIRRAAGVKQTSRTYYQRLTPGRSLSVTFLANGKRAAIVGINQQWTTGPQSGLPYQFGGAVGGMTIPARVRREIKSQLDRLVAATGMVGLNGMDFQLHGDRWSVLEINPRPTATMELYDRDYSRGLFDRHVRACRGELPDRMPRPRACRALAIVTAAESWESSDRFRFPRWCRDIPRPGLRFAAGDPLCTVHASAATPRAALSLVRRRQENLLELLFSASVAA